MADKPAPKGIEIRDAHFPGRAPIDSYGNGGFRFADMSHRGSILCLPSGIHGWKVASLADVSLETLQPILAEAGSMEMIVFGTGDDLLRLPVGCREALTDAGLRVEVMNTGAAVRSLNIMLSEERAVGAALIAVDSVKRGR